MLTGRVKSCRNNQALGRKDTSGRAHFHKRPRAPSADPSTAFASSLQRFIASESDMGAKILVLCSPTSPELNVLQQLPPGSEVVGVGRSLAELALSESQLADVDILAISGVGANAAKKADVQEVWPMLKGLKWIYSSSAGLENLLFPELIESPVLLTNAKGVYSNSLAEYALTACNWFAKDLPRLQRAKAARNWDPYEVEELRGKTMGVVGYGDIGQSCARLARAFKMHVVGLRRRAELSEKEKREGLVDAMYTPNQLTELMSRSDYVVMSTPYTPQTEKLVNAAATAQKTNAVFITKYKTAEG
ncbi:hypothetical protein DUNSADRAFT_15114 [Dunaliella salina]|uniref:D-isomer specific 2-hydroxyacid dehydrogenase NAD-binding domain-containing protein n=1 Tax=Dunaliella salina TaxID=3046 RepID=A0ABQ7H233_DUNSA|nr:hypothetical protein DUNSADRAFT_15114 [Dunaliella salina]|eukprot:KAF5840915.1 hypothetical protein DUNSADRAFT_15114 [Dunaliella salina]